MPSLSAATLSLLLPALSLLLLVPSAAAEASPPARLTVNGTALLDPAAEAPPPARLTVNGTALLDPSGNAVRLTGFNMGNHLHTGDAAYMQQLLPGANVVRLVALMWDNTGNPSPDSDCMTSTAPYIKETCLKRLDKQIEQITGKRGPSAPGVARTPTTAPPTPWVIITCRAKWGAGQDYDTDPASDVFHNATLRSNMYAMWAHVAARYKPWEQIAAYEIMSEPRDKAATPDQVRGFYAGGCAAVHGVDALTPCMVGPGPYYKLWDFDASIVLPGDTNVIYTFDYFQPTNYIFAKGTPAVSSYPGNYPCGSLYLNFASKCCASLPGGATATVAFDRSWHLNNFLKYAVALREKAKVPVFMNQWSVVRNVADSAGRLAFVADVANLTQQLDIGWAWWTWAGGNSDGWSHGSSEVVFHWPNGSYMVDTAVLAAMRPYW